MKLTLYISIIFFLSLSANIYSQIDPRNVDIIKDEIPPKPEDGNCYELIKVISKEKTPSQKDSTFTRWTSNPYRISKYRETPTWQQFVCDKDLTHNFYEVLLAAFKENGYPPRKNYGLGRNIKSYEKDIKTQAMSCFYNYHFNNKLLGDKINFAVLDSLGIQLNNLDEHIAYYNIIPPTLKQQMKYSVYIDLDEIDVNGLKKTESGLKPVIYNYLIPNKTEYIKALKNIDPSFQLVNIPKEKMALISSEMGFEDAVFATGSTNQANYLEVLQQLIELDYVNQIHEVKSADRN